MTTEITSFNDSASELSEGVLENPSRRLLFKRAAVGGGAVLAAGMGSYAAAKDALQGAISATGIEVDETFKPMDQRNLLLTYASSQHLAEKYPERNEQYARLHKVDFNFQEGAKTFEHKPFDPNKPGYTQLDQALQHAGWHPLKETGNIVSAYTSLGAPLHTWDQSAREEHVYEFSSDQEAATSIRSAARLFGAVRCGIAKHDPRCDYHPLFNTMTGEEKSWEHDFPFKPKSVIVMLLPMDYDAMATAPSRISSAAAANVYSHMTVLASQMAKFMQGLGYSAVASGNDLGNSVAYAIMAGLGEGARCNAIIAPGFGPRVRICKVYTDFDFGDAYDEPHNWGIAEFCKSCKKCAEACPGKAISHDDDMSFHPTHEFADEPGYTWSNHTGVKKFHTDAKKCFNYWVDNDGDCGACIAACTFNEPDYWHHWFIMAINPFTPKVIHSMMAELHPAFGYGGTQDPEKVKKFWKTGEGMRVNTSNKHTYGTSNIS